MADTNIFHENTYYASHEFEIYINNIEINKNNLIVTKLYCGKGGYHEKGKETFGTFWTIPIFRSETQYVWNKNDKSFVKKEEKKNIPILCQCLVNSLRMREKPKLESNIIKNIILNEELIITEITGGYIEEKTELEPGIFGYWIKVIDKNNNSGWAFSYYLDFKYPYLNTYMKYNGKKEGIFDSMRKAKLVHFNL